jgi:hypothetical protein
VICIHVKFSGQVEQQNFCGLTAQYAAHGNLWFRSDCEASDRQYPVRIGDNAAGMSGSYLV